MRHFDLETRSAADLYAVGSYPYAEDPTTDILIAGWYDDRTLESWLWLPLEKSFKVTAERVKVRLKEVEFNRLRGLLTTEEQNNLDRVNEAREAAAAFVEKTFPTIFVHHAASLPPWIDDQVKRVWMGLNSFSFDRTIWREKKLPEPAGWRDLMRDLRVLGLPSSLEGAGSALTGMGKDKSGADHIKSLSIPQKFVGGVPEFRSPNVQSYTDFAAYNLIDIAVQARVFALTEPIFSHPIFDTERKISDIDDRANQLGIGVDLQLAHALVSAGDKDYEQRKIAMVQKLGLSSVEEVEAALCKGAPNFQKTILKIGGPVLPLTESSKPSPKTDKQTLEDVALEHPDNELLLEAIALRQSKSRSYHAKASAAIRTACRDERMRDTLSYANARTLRWTARKFQPQNLPRGDSRVDVDKAIADLKKGKLPQIPEGLRLDDVLVAVTRSIMIPSKGHGYIIADLAGIELRTVYWIANDYENLRVCVESDVYCKNASQVFGRRITKADKAERQVGKILTLSGVYGAGAPSITKQMRKERIDLKALKLTPEGMRDAFRDANPVLKGFWEDCAEAIKYALADGMEARAGKIRFKPVPFIGMHPRRVEGASDIGIILPSGGRRYLRNVALQDNQEALFWYSKAVYGDDPDAEPEDEELLYEDTESSWSDKPSLHYDIYQGASIRRDKTYGGKICQFSNQSIARDILTDAMIRIDKEGFKIIGSVHDELIVEAPLDRLEEGARRVGEILTSRAPWASDLPLGSEVFTCSSYRKDPQPGWPCGVAKDGAITKWEGWEVF